MRQFLEARNHALLLDLEELTRALTSSNIPRELQPYRDRLLSVCEQLQRMTNRNITDLALGQDWILEDVLIDCCINNATISAKKGAGPIA